ncbi:uncharacterized protein LOC143497916 isoform X2 [Brachyhypopomus gauderio]
MQFLEVTQTLLPHLVTPIKHMKIMFGLKTLVIMWMLWGDQDVASINDKIRKFFPDSFPQYHRCNRRHMELMQKTHQDFRNFAQSLARNPDIRKVYIRDLMEEQYGEHYAQKLEERLFHYLEELNEALPQSTCIEKVLTRPWPLGEKEELLQQILTCSTASVHTALKRLLRCAIADFYRNDFPHEPVEGAGAVRSGFRPFSIGFGPSQERPGSETLLEASMQGTWLDKSLLCQKNSEKTYLDGEVMRLWKKPSLRTEIEQAVACPHVPGEGSQGVGTGRTAQHQEVEIDSAEHLCSRHGKRMKSILLECSEELQAQDRHTPGMQAECTPPSPPSPLLQSTPYRLTQASSPLLQDSSSTNISFTSHPDSPVRDLSQAEASQASLSQQSFHNLDSSLVQQNTLRTSLGPSSALSIKHIPAPLSLPQSSSSASPSVIPAKQIAAHHSSLSPASQPSVYPESSSSRFSFHCITSSSSSAPVAAASPGRDTEQARGAGRYTSGLPVVMASSRASGGGVKLSPETQAFLLLCKWLQPHVRMCRLSQEEQNTVVLARTDKGQGLEQRELDVEEDVEANVSLDVNVLYSDSYSESDTDDSDDPDYVPSRRLQA